MNCDAMREMKRNRVGNFEITQCFMAGVVIRCVN